MLFMHCYFMNSKLKKKKNETKIELGIPVIKWPWYTLILNEFCNII